MTDLSGKRIALTVGSRGIAQLDRIVIALVGALAEHGAKPFVVPAMGSHGGGTAEGHAEVEEDRAIWQDGELMALAIRNGLMEPPSTRLQ